MSPIQDGYTLSSHQYLDRVINLHKQGWAIGIPSICSSNPFVIQASFRNALKREVPVLIESTCNQVNQFGGYAGLTPPEFVRYVNDIADQMAFPPSNVILGGDHLGPYPWRYEPGEKAMHKAKTLVQEYVRAGYTKIHLDASMPCGGDNPDLFLETQVAASRTAELAQAAELASKEPGDLRYVIGSEVPIPGGIQEKVGHLAVTTVATVAETIEVTHQAFREKGIEEAWQRVIAVVVHPGVEFGNEVIYAYDPSFSAGLSRFIEAYDHLVYEAHSTDYQTAQALKGMVSDHFAILKVGPALTFSLREALFSLAMIEEELIAFKPEFEPSRLLEALEETMIEDPSHWEKYYPGEPAYQRFARRYSFSDRIRYYWPYPRVQNAVARLLENLNQTQLPLSLLSQFFPRQYWLIREGLLDNNPQSIILDKIDVVLQDYTGACGG